MAPPPPPLDETARPIATGQRPPPPTRSSTVDLAAELNKEYLTIEQNPFASGAFSDVYPGRWEPPNDLKYPNGIDVAVKVFRLGGVVADPNYAANNEKCGKHLGREVFVWQRVDHPRITPFVGYIRGFKDEVVPCIVSPRRQANLVAYITTINPQADRLRLLCQALEGLVYLHTFSPSPIVHLDIKPENILVTDEGTAELCDFGYAKVLDGVSTGFTTGPNPGGSYPYMAPETLMGAGYSNLTPGADIYAIGSTILYVLSGKRAWHNLKGKGLLTIAIIRGELPKWADHPMEGSEEAVKKTWDLLRRCWHMVADQRPSAQEVLDELLAIEALGEPIRKGVQFGINGSKWRHLPDCIGDKVKKEVRGYERDKNVSRKDFKGFDKLPKSDQGRVVETFEFDKPFDHVSFRKKPEIDWHGEKKEGLAASTSSTPSLWHEESSVVQWPDDEEVQLSGDRAWAEIASQEERGRGSAKSGISGSSHDPRMSSVSSGGKYDISLSSSRNLSQTRNGERNPPTMPAPQNKGRGRPVKGKKEKPTRKAAVTHEWVPPKPQSQRDVVGSSWGDAAPSWGDAAPSWGDDDDTPSNKKPASDSVWDNPALKPDSESGATAEASWGTEEWTYPGASPDGEGQPVDESGYQNGAATGYRNDTSSGNTWGNEGWVAWGTEAATPAMDSGWVYGTDSYSGEHDQQQSEGAYGGYGSQEGTWGQEASTSWDYEPNSDDTTGQANEPGHALQAKPLSAFRLNPAASVFVPRSIPPAVTEEVAVKQTPSLPAPAEPLSDTTPSTTTHSFNPQSTLDSGIASTPVTCLTDADPQTTDVTEQLHQVDLQVAEYKLGVSQATLEVKKANLDVMRAKLEAMEKRRAVLAGYHTGEPKQCTRPGCEAAGGMLVAGQLVVHTQDGSTQNTRHLDCLSKDQKKTARKRVKGPGDLPGLKNLRADDKKRVREAFGLNEDTQSVQGGQNNKGRSDEKADAKGKGKANASERGPQGNAPGSSRQHIETRPISPAQSQSWYDGTGPSWDDPEPPKPPPVTAPSARGKERESGNKQDGRRNAPPETRVQPVSPPAAAPQQTSGTNRPKQTGNQDFGNRNPPTPSAPEITPVVNIPVANPSPPQAAPPAPPKPEIDPAVLMRLELEDKEAEARLVEAELLLAETRVRVETARRAVVAQKLLMARAGVSPTI